MDRRARFDLDLVDVHKPFELDDDNMPHLAKHAPFTHDDATDAWLFGRPCFYPARPDGAADWLMVGEVAGQGLVLVPLAPSHSGDPQCCRPIGIYRPSAALAARYREDAG